MPSRKTKKRKARHYGAACCTDGNSAEAATAMVQCANSSAPGLSDVASSLGSRSAKSRAGRASPLIMVMQLATPNLWHGFCRYSAAVNSEWARRKGHQYQITAGSYLQRSDLWRGGNVRAVLEVMNSVPMEIEWLFHLDCDAAIVDFSDQDALVHAIQRFGSPHTEVLLSRDETGFAGSSRLANMGTGLWRRSTWTKQLVSAWWEELSSDTNLNEQEVLEKLLKSNRFGCTERITLLPAGFLNSESANPISSPPVRQPVIHLAGMPDEVRIAVFRAVWDQVCVGDAASGLDPNSWELRDLMLREFRLLVEGLPDTIPTGSWSEASAPARFTRRLALALHRGGRDRADAARFFGVALRRALALEAAGQPAQPVALFLESLAGPLLELGRHGESLELMLRPRPLEAGPRNRLDELVRAENLCAAFQAEGRFKEAEVLARQALYGLNDAFPESTHDVRPPAARARLAHVLHVQGFAAEAEPFLREALRGYEASLGKNHPETLGCVRNLAVLLKQVAQSEDGRKPFTQQRLAEVEGLLKRAQHGYMKALGSEHPEAQRAVRNVINFQHWRDQKYGKSSMPASPHTSRLRQAEL